MPINKQNKETRVTKDLNIFNQVNGFQPIMCNISRYKATPEVIGPIDQLHTPPLESHVLWSFSKQTVLRQCY